MGSNLLTTASTILCPHGGQSILLTSNTRVTAGGSPVLLESDIHTVAGCPFTVGNKYSPCVRIEWNAGVTKSAVSGTAPLVQTSVGRCLSAEGALQGVAIIANMQLKGSTL